MVISLELADGSAFPAWDGFLLLPGVCPAARVQIAARSTQTALCALVGPGKGCSRGALTAGDLRHSLALAKS